MEPWILVTKVENSVAGSKSLKIGLQIVWNMRKNISKICRRNSTLPEVMSDLVRPEMKKILNRKSKNILSESL